jgi:hypothetical protein
MLRLAPHLGVLWLVASLSTTGCRSSERAAERVPELGSQGVPSPSKEPAAMRTYEILLSTVASMPKAKVSIELPPSWKDEVGPDGAPTFSSPSLAGLTFGVFAVPTEEGEPAARIAQAFKWQYEDGTGVTREQKPDGRLWTSRVEGKITHARMFVPVEGGVVMGVAMLRNLTDVQLAEVKATFETLKVVAQ